MDETREPQANAERLFQRQPVPCVDLDLEGKLVRANPAFCRVAGRAESELVGISIFDFASLERRASMKAAFAQFLDRESVSFEGPLLRADGDERWLEWRGVACPEEQLVRFVAYDATSLWRAERDARERERFMETLLANLPGTVYRCKNDPKWTIEFISAGCEPLTGYSVDDLLENKRMSFTEMMSTPGDAEYVWASVQAAIAVRGQFSMKYRIRTKAGEEKWVHEQGRGVFSPEGDLLALEGFITDITAQVSAEAELEEKIRVIEEQQAQIQDLSLPIIEIWDSVLTLPVVGALDDARATRIMEGLLDAVVRTQSTHVIVDLTAVASVDATVAEHLVRILRAVSLLGSRGILSGIQPAVAQAFVELAADLGGVPTMPDLRAALRSCMRGVKGKGSAPSPRKGASSTR